MVGEDGAAAGGGDFAQPFVPAGGEHGGGQFAGLLAGGHQAGALADLALHVFELGLRI